MYVAVKGGEKAIRNAHRLLAEARRGDPGVPEIGIDQIMEQLGLAVDRVMGEGSLYDRQLAALALKQARGDVIEAVFLARAFRTTLPRFGASLPLETGAMAVRRRISATFKDLPGGQVLGPTFDYTHRLLDERLATFAGGSVPDDREAGDAATEAPPAALSLTAADAIIAVTSLPAAPDGAAAPPQAGAGQADAPPLADRTHPAAAPAPATPRVTDLLDADGLVEAAPPDDGTTPADITREPVTFPAGRDARLQALARGDEGFLLGLGYSSQRGYARTHPFVGELRCGAVEVSLLVEELGFSVPLGDIFVTECQSVNQFKGSAGAPPHFTRGYGLVFGQSERKALAMALVDRTLRARELGEEVTAPAQDEEFVLSHCDNVQATGFVEHLKLPHYVDFQAELALVRRLRAEHGAAGGEDSVIAEPPEAATAKEAAE